jgi:hypothetical protein
MDGSVTRYHFDMTTWPARTYDVGGMFYCRACDTQVAQKVFDIVAPTDPAGKFRRGYLHGRAECWRAIRRQLKLDDAFISHLKHTKGESDTIVHAGAAVFIAWWTERGFRIREAVHGRAPWDRHVLARPKAG